MLFRSAEEYDLDQGNRIVNPSYITEKMAIRFFSMFWGREDAVSYTHLVYNAFQFDTNNFDKCTGKCKSPTYLSDWELYISTNSACNGNVYSDGNSLTAFYL